LLVLDEPTNGLDFIARDELLTSIKQMVQTEGAPTIIFVTHHLEEILPFFTHVLLLKNGQVYSQGKREKVLTDENLTRFLQRDVHIEWIDQRTWITLND